LQSPVEVITFKAQGQWYVSAAFIQYLLSYSVICIKQAKCLSGL